MNDHLDIYAAEAAALEPTDWERWIDRVEEFLGHDADGHLREDGYSLDTFLDMYEAGLSVEDAAVRIIGAVFITPEGVAHRLESAQKDPLSDEYIERYKTMYHSGFAHWSGKLPPDTKCVWSPDPQQASTGL